MHGYAFLGNTPYQENIETNFWRGMIPTNATVQPGIKPQLFVFSLIWFMCTFFSLQWFENSWNGFVCIWATFGPRGCHGYIHTTDLISQCTGMCCYSMKLQCKGGSCVATAPHEIGHTSLVGVPRNGGYFEHGMLRSQTCFASCSKLHGGFVVVRPISPWKWREMMEQDVIQPIALMRHLSSYGFPSKKCTNH